MPTASPPGTTPDPLTPADPTTARRAWRQDVLAQLRDVAPGGTASFDLPTDAFERRERYRLAGGAAHTLWGSGSYTVRNAGTQVVITRRAAETSGPAPAVTQATLLPIASLRRDGGTQPRATLNLHWVEEYGQDMAAGAVFPPVVVFYDGTAHWLADGFHRTEAALAIGADTIAADVRQGTQRDAVLFSVGANGTHGQRRTNEDKRRAVLTLLDDPEWAGWSDAEIARRCGVSPHSVKAQRPAHTMQTQSMPAERTFTHPRTGKPTTMNTANIGRRAAVTIQAPSAPDPLAVHDVASRTAERFARADAERTAASTRATTPAPVDHPVPEPEPPPTPEPRFDREAADLHRDTMAAIARLATAPAPRVVMDASNKNRGRGVLPEAVQRAAGWLGEFAALYAVEEPIRVQQVQAWVASIGGGDVAA